MEAAATRDRSDTPTKVEPGAQREARDLTIARLALPIILLAFIAFFSVARPDTFFTVGNAETILITQSVLAILAIATILPLIIGEFDLSVAANLGLGAILVTGLPSKEGWDFLPALLVALSVCTLVGVTNGLLVARIGINALIVTLGMSSIITGAVLWYSGGVIISRGIPTQLTALGDDGPAGIPLPIIYLVIIVAVVWYLLEQTPFGRYLYAIGGSKSAARLSGLRVKLLTVVAFAASGFLAGIAGVLASATLGSGNPNVGPPLLLAAFAAAFLGATSIKPGSYNVLGTVFGVFTIATGVVGLQLMGVAFYIEPVFQGAALIVAVAATRYLRREAF